MRIKNVGRLLRATAPTARVLTEYRVRGLTRAELSADVAHCMRLATPGSTAIDVGASVGNYALAMSKAVGRNGRVLALEANPTVFGELVHSTWGSRVSPLNLAASNTSGWATMKVPVGKDGQQNKWLATLEARDQDGVSFEVQCTRLDDLADGARPVSVIKIDVEGHEAKVIEGATEVIERNSPALVIEIEERHLVGRSVADVVKLLTDRGYECSGIHGRALLPWSEFDIARWQTEWLAKDPAWQQRHKLDYVNNFLFTRR